MGLLQFGFLSLLCCSFVLCDALWNGICCLRGVMAVGHIDAVVLFSLGL